VQLGKDLVNDRCLTSQGDPTRTTGRIKQIIGPQCAAYVFAATRFEMLSERRRQRMSPIFAAGIYPSLAPKVEGVDSPKRCQPVRLTFGYFKKYSTVRISSFWATALSKCLRARRSTLVPGLILR
jgi:hypothetical protein